MIKPFVKKIMSVAFAGAILLPTGEVFAGNDNNTKPSLKSGSKSAALKVRLKKIGSESTTEKDDEFSDDILDVNEMSDVPQKEEKLDHKTFEEENYISWESEGELPTIPKLNETPDVSQKEEKKPSIKLLDFDLNHMFPRKEKKVARKTIKENNSISWGPEGEPSTIPKLNETSDVPQKEEKKPLIKLNISIDNLALERENNLTPEIVMENLREIKRGDGYTVYEKENSGFLVNVRRIEPSPLDMMYSPLRGINFNRNNELYGDLVINILKMVGKLKEDKHMCENLIKLYSTFSECRPDVNKPEGRYCFEESEFVDICKNIISNKWESIQGDCLMDILGRKNLLKISIKEKPAKGSARTVKVDSAVDYWEFVKEFINQKIKNANLESFEDLYNIEQPLFRDIDSLRRDIVHKTIAFLGLVTQGQYKGKYVVLMESEGKTAELMLI